MKHTITISPRGLTRVLAVIVVGLILAGLAAGYAKASFSEEYLHHIHLFGIVGKFDLDSEQNIPSWYQAFSLLLCSLLLAVIAAGKKRLGDRYVFHWGALSAIFLGLSLDEAASLHEMTVDPLKSALHTSGAFTFAWVILGVAFVLIVGLAYLRFIFHLPKRYGFLFVIAGAIFVSGAVGMEMVDGKYLATHGRDLTYAMLTVVEESLEMFGILLFIYSLTSYLSVHLKEVRIGIGEKVASLGAAHRPGGVYEKGSELRRRTA